MIDTLIRASRTRPDFDQWVCAHSVGAFRQDVALDLFRASGQGNGLDGTPLESELAELAQCAANPATSEIVLQDAWNGVRRDLSGYERPDSLLGLAVVAPVVYRLGGSQAAVEVVSAIEQVAGWWA